MIRCLIVEDEIAGQEILKKKIKTHFPEMKILSIIDSKDKAIKFIQKNEIDLLFLDVQIKGGTGIEIAQMCEDLDVEIVFITAYKEYAIDAINNNASYYLLKPLHDAEFKKGMDIIVKKINDKKTVTSILVLNKNVHVPIQVENILYFKSDGAYSYIVTKEERYLSSKNIGHYEQLLMQNFIRAHHQYLVNTKEISSLLKERSGQIIMSNGDEIPVSQRKITDVISALKE